MTDMTISTERVLELIDAYGAEPGAWPEEERAAASLRIAESPDVFASALADARALDQLLLSEIIPEPSAALSDAILAEAPTVNAEQKRTAFRLSSLLFPQGARWPAGAALASLLMGLVGGYSYASTGVGYDQVDVAYYAAFGIDGGDDWVLAE